MLAPTHLVLGQTAFLAACIVAGHAPTLPEAVVAAGTSLLPDLDKRNSIIGRLFPFISEPIDFHFGHRTLTHSLLFQLIAGAALYWLLPFGGFLAVTCGIVSHAVGDMMTPHGVAWLWPSQARCVLPGNTRFRMKPMGWGELWFALLLAASAFPLLGMAQSGAGTTGLIRQALGDITRARADYDAEKGGFAWTLRIEGRDNRTFDDVRGEYAVIGPWKEGGFILDTENGPRSACRASGCDWYTDRAVVVRGAAEQTTVREIKAKTASVAALREALAPLVAVGQVYLLGSLGGREIPPQPPTVAVSGDTVELRYARPSVLGGWHDEVLRDVELTVQVRHTPGQSVPGIVLAGDNKPALPPLLGRWVE